MEEHNFYGGIQQYFGEYFGEDPLRQSQVKRQSGAQDPQDNQSDENQEADNGKSSKKEDQQNESNNDKNQKSLANLSVRFKEMIQKNPNLTLDLNQTSNEIQCQKRRLYDIVNVLEGVGYTQKLEKNKVRWLGGCSYQEMEKEITKNKQIIDVLASRDKQLDAELQEMSALLKEMEEEDQFDYIYENDLKEIKTSTCNSSEAMIVVKPVAGDSLESPYKISVVEGVYTMRLQCSGSCEIFIANNQKHEKSRNLRSRNIPKQRTPIMI